MIQVRLFLFTFLFFLLSIETNGQIQYNDMVFNKLGQSFLDNASAITVSPDGGYMYVSSSDDASISLFRRNDNGTLIFIKMYKNELAGVSGLTETYEVKVSPDGRHLYATGVADNALVFFERDKASGLLTFKGKYEDGVDGINGLSAAFKMDFSPDGNYLYVIGRDENALNVYNRNVVTGALSQIQVLRDNEGGNDNMNYPVEVAVSADGKLVFVTSYGDKSLNWYSRNIETGILELTGSITNAMLGSGAALEGAYGLGTSPDGKSIYVASKDGNSIDVFHRSLSTENITYQESMENGTGGITGLLSTAAVSVSADGERVYAAGTNQDAVIVFDRNIFTGNLEYVETIYNGGGVTGIDYPIDFAVSDVFDELYVVNHASHTISAFEPLSSTQSLQFLFTQGEGNTGIKGLKGGVDASLSFDGQYLYTISKSDDALTVFSRNTEDGSISYVNYFEDGVDGIDGLKGARSMVFSGNGVDLYIAGYWDNSVTHFRRDIINGEMSYIGMYKDGFSGINGIGGTNSVVLSNNGLYLFASGEWDNGIGIFSRNPTTGALTFESAILDGQNGINGLQGVRQLLKSPNGEFLYALGEGDELISVFTLSQTDGSLGFQGVEHIGSAKHMVINNIGGYLYTIDGTNALISKYEVNSGTGMLTLAATFEENPGSTSYYGLENADKLVLSPNGQRMYVLSSTENTLATYLVDDQTGDITFERLYSNDEDGIHGLGGVASLAMDETGRNIYAVSGEDEAVALFTCAYIYEEVHSICQDDSVTIAGNTYTASGTYRDTIWEEDCMNIIHLDLEVQGGEYTYQVDVCDGDFYIFGNQAYNTSGVYTNNFSSYSGCDSTVTIALNIVDEFLIEERTVHICEGSTYELGGQTFSTSGTYPIVWSNGNDCDSAVTLTLVVLPISTTSVEEVICEGSFYVLNDQNVIDEGNYIDTLQNINGCDSIVHITFSSYPSSTIMEVSICEGEAYEFSGNNYTESGTYEGVVNSITGCEIATTLILSVVENFDTDTTITNIDAETYTASVITTGGVEPFTYSWSHGENSETVNLERGVYYEAVVTDANGCSKVVVFDLDITTSVKNEEEGAIKIYPNPTTESMGINIDMSNIKDEQVTVKIFDIRGALVIYDEFTINSQPVYHTKEMSSGVYIVQITNREGEQYLEKVEVF